MIVQNEIVGNTAGGSGSAISMMGPSSAPRSRLVANTIVAGPDDDSISVVDIDGWTAAVEIVNNAISTDTGIAVDCGDVYYQGDPTWTANLIWSGTGEHHAGRCITTDGSNLNADPGFYTATFVPGADFPLVDAGVTHPDLGPLDLARSARVVDGNRDGIAVIDIGAYERESVATVAAKPARAWTKQLRGQRLRVTWRPPTDDGGAPIEQYRIEEMRSGRTFVVDGDARSIVINKIGRRTPYKIRISAINAVGAGPVRVIRPRPRRVARTRPAEPKPGGGGQRDDTGAGGQGWTLCCIR